MTERGVKSSDVLVDLAKQRVEVRVVDVHGDIFQMFLGTDAAADMAKQLNAAAAAIRTAAK